MEMDTHHGPEENVQKVVIVGGGTAGWMTAAALAEAFQGKMNVQLVESDQIGTVGVGEATVPGIRDFNQILGLDEVDFMRETHATYKLGINFNNWGKIGDEYLHPFGDFGRPQDGISFHQNCAFLNSTGENVSLHDYSVCSLASSRGKFDHPSKYNADMAQYRYAYHFDAHLYAAYLRKIAEKKNVQRVEGKIIKVHQNPENGFIQSVETDKGDVVEGDLFVDCSGFRSLLLGETLGVGFEDWSEWLPVNTALAVPCEKTGPSTPYTRATAHGAGWQWRIPTRTRTGNGHVFCDDYMSVDEATSILLENLDGKPLADPRPIRFTTGRRQKMWEKNCIAIGLSGGFLEPLESTSIFLIQTAIIRMITFFPGKHMTSVERNEYNRLIINQFDEIKDFIILHYHATQRDDTDFWNYCRTMDVPDGVKRMIELFKVRGRVSRSAEDLFQEPSLVAVMMGQNIMPNNFDPRTSTYNRRELLKRVNTMRARFTQTVSIMPTHDQFLDQYCPMGE